MFAYSLCIAYMIVCYIDSDIGLLRKDAVFTYTICTACITVSLEWLCYIDTDIVHYVAVFTYFLCIT